MNLLSQAVENINRMQTELRSDHKDDIAKFEARTEAIRKETDTKITGLRMAMEAQISDHERSDAPHPTTLGLRVSRLETTANRLTGGLILAGSVGVTGVIALIRGFQG